MKWVISNGITPGSVCTLTFSASSLKPTKVTAGIGWSHRLPHHYLLIILDDFSSHLRLGPIYTSFVRKVLRLI
jgi:hypothetical protein